MQKTLIKLKVLWYLENIETAQVSDYEESTQVSVHFELELFV